MNAPKIIAFCSTTLLAVAAAHAQGTFQNLNFESGNPGPDNFAFNVPATNALPFWTVYYGNVQQTQIGYNIVTSGTTIVSLSGGTSGYAIDGNYSVDLECGVTASAASISQTGLIPAGSQSLLFEADAGPGTLDISIGSQIVPFAMVGSGPDYTLYGANISAWAGDTEQLTFSALGDGVFNDWLVDDILFSAVPEPNIVTLTAIGGLFFGARKWLAQR